MWHGMVSGVYFFHQQIEHWVELKERAWPAVEEDDR